MYSSQGLSKNCQCLYSTTCMSVLEQTENKKGGKTKYLGIIIDENLNWDYTQKPWIFQQTFGEDCQDTDHVEFCMYLMIEGD